MAQAGSSETFGRNVRWQFAGSASQAVLSGLMLLVLGRELSATGFGIYSIIMGFVYVANLVLEPRMQDVAARCFWNIDLARFDPLHATRVVDLFILESWVKLLPCIALLLLAPSLARLAHLPPDTAIVIGVAAVGLYMSKLANGLSIGLLRVLGRSDLLAYCVTAELLVRLVCTVAWAHFFPLSVTAAIVILCIGAMLTNFAQWILLNQLLPQWRSALPQWRMTGLSSRMSEYRRLLLSNFGLSMADLMNKDLDVALISPLVPSDQVGVYKMAKNITLLAWRAIDPFYLALMPEVNRLIALGDHVALRRLLARTCRGLLALSIGLGALCYLAVVHFATDLLGSAFGGVAALMPWLLAGIVVSAPFIWGHPLAVALNRADLALAASLAGTLLGLGGFVLLTPTFGTEGAGMAWSMTLIVSVGGAALLSRRAWRRKMQN